MTATPPENTIPIVPIDIDTRKNLGELWFSRTPQIGEWIEIDVQGVGTAYEVVMVVHSIDGPRSGLYVKNLGGSNEAIANLG